MGRLKLFLPLAAFAIVAGFFMMVLNRIDEGDYNPQAMPSTLVNKPFPNFELAKLEDLQQQLTRSDLLGEIALINVWATWCPSCHVEHDYLNYLAREKGIVIYGVNYNDEAVKANNWLREKGNPYKFSVFDVQGRLALDMGVTGAPETYVIDHRGFVRMRFQGPLSEVVWQREFQQLYMRLQQEQREQREATG